MENYTVETISYQDVKPWILLKHYAKRMPSISYSFGLFYNKELVGVITYGSPPSQSLCRGVCGVENRGIVLELNRLCLRDNKKNESSFLIGSSLKLLPKPSIVISYADTSMNHVGYVYQATNWIYTGLSDKRTEWREINSNKHSKTICEQTTLEERKQKTDKYKVVERPRKHRYVYFVGNKRHKKELLKKLNYPQSQYPKGDSLKYDSSNNFSTQLKLW